MNLGVIVELVGIILSALISIAAIFATSKNTRDHLTHKLDTNQQVMNNEIEHIKDDITDIKLDVRTHNHYAQLFNENIPVIKEQIKVANHRIEDLEQTVKIIQSPIQSNNTHQ